MKDLEKLISISSLASKLRVSMQYVFKKIKRDQEKYGSDCLVELGKKYYEVLVIGDRPILKETTTK